MEFINSNKYGELTETVILQFETIINHRLPSEYRAYLKAHNGGKPTPSDIKTTEFESNIHHMYGIHGGPSYESLANNVSTFKGRIPASLLPFADDDCGNQHCIGVSGEYIDKIYFWNHEEESPDDINPYWDNIIKTADSFNEFLNSLYKWVDPNEKEIDRIIASNDINALMNLIDTGLCLEVEDEYGRTLIENAAIAANDEMIMFLFKKGATLRNSLQYAIQNAEFFDEHKKTVELINALLRISK